MPLLGLTALFGDHLRIARNGERERSSVAFVRLRPKTAAMTLDDGAADKQTDAHAAALGRVEGFEQSFRIPRMETYPGVSDGDTHLRAVMPLGPDEQVPRTIFDIAHSVRGIS